MPARMPLLFIALVALAGAPTVVAGDASTVTLELVKRGNVRFGPTTAVKNVAVTLNPGDTVAALGVVPGKAEWIKIRFPRAGRAWVHGRNLAPTSDPKRFRCTIDGANVRSDSRVNADLVGQLAKDEIVEWTGGKVGEWRAIYPANALAFVHESVLALDAGKRRLLLDLAEGQSRAGRQWRSVKFRYEHYREIYNQDQRLALRLAWKRLAEDVAMVVAEHPSIRTRLVAQKLQRDIAGIVAAATSYQEREGIVPLPDPEMPKPVATPIPAPAPASTPTPTPTPPPPPAVADPASAVTAPAASGDPAPAVDSGAVELVEDPVSPPAPTPATVAPDDGQTGLTGFVEQADDPGVGTTDVLIDGAGTVLAYLDAKGAGIALSEYYWRFVRVHGSQRAVEVDGRTVTVITVAKIRLEGG